MGGEDAGMTSTNALTELGSLRRDAPDTIAGYRRFRSIIDSDGALPARLKRLFVACAATVKGYDDLALRELEAARALGLTQTEARAAVAILSSVRGEGAALRFHDFFSRAYPEAIEPEAPDSDRIVQPGEAEANFLAYFGTMPPSLGKLLALLPVGADAYYLMREGTLSGTVLDKAHSELLLVAVLAADYSDWTNVHMDGARRAGASEAAVAEAIVCAVPVAGLSAWVVGATQMDVHGA
jgi:alkylhydroperoxidase/carboxymuconolactone decarboxylase family protein YurZ